MGDLYLSATPDGVEQGGGQPEPEEPPRQGSCSGGESGPVQVRAIPALARARELAKSVGLPITCVEVCDDGSLIVHNSPDWRKKR